MKRIELTRSDAAANIAFDEALLISAEQASGVEAPPEFLRIWEPQQPIVVIGRASKIGEESNLDLCTRLGVPVIRRCSGGAAIAAVPGCLMYAVVLSVQLRPELAAVNVAHQFVLGRLADAIATQIPNVSIRGISDLAVDDRKFSGNSLRCKRTHVLYHGTLLYAADTALISRLLGTPPRQPDYRNQRSHADFITNLPLERDTLAAAVRAAFPSESVESWPVELTRQLVAEKYSTNDWNRKF